MNDVIENMQKISFKWHVILSLGFLLALSLIGCAINAKQQSGLAAANLKLQEVQKQLKERDTENQKNAANTQAEQKNQFSDLLVKSSSSDEVVKEMSRLAAADGIVLNTLAITQVAATPNELGKVQYNVTLKADYFVFKTWLKGLLDRYPALGLNTMVIQAPNTDSVKQNINLSLFLYTKE